MAKKTASVEQPAAEATEATISKMEAVRRTLAEGIQKPLEAVSHIKEKFGIEITPIVFSSYKSGINKKKGASSGKRGRKPKGSGSDGNGSAVKFGTGVDNGIVASDVSLHLAREIKSLVGKYGAEAVKGMADIFAA